MRSPCLYKQHGGGGICRPLCAICSLLASNMRETRFNLIYFIKAVNWFLFTDWKNIQILLIFFIYNMDIRISFIDNFVTGHVLHVNIQGMFLGTFNGRSCFDAFKVYIFESY